MRLLFLSDLWNPFPGGAERYIFNVAREMKRRGHEVYALTSYEKATPGYSEYLQVDEKLGQHTMYSRAERAPNLRKWRDSFKPDVIIVHRFFAEEYDSILQEKPGIPRVEIVHQHQHVLGPAFRIYNSEYTRSQNVHRPEDITMLPPAYIDEVRTESHADAIGFIKPLEGKGVDLVYQIAERLPKRQFVILRGEWQSIETIKQLPNITFLDPVASMKEFYSRCSVVLVPSLREDAGTVPQEAAFAGVPCISSRVMGLIETNAAGIFPSHPYVECWVEEIDRLSNQHYYADVVERQKAFVNRYDWPSHFDYLNERLTSL